MEERCDKLKLKNFLTLKGGFFFADLSLVFLILLQKRQGISCQNDERNLNDEGALRLAKKHWNFRLSHEIVKGKRLILLKMALAQVVFFSWQTRFLSTERYEHVSLSALIALCKQHSCYLVF